MSSPKRISDGSVDFSGGVDSSRVSTIQSLANPNGLKRNELAWMTNCTVRDGGVLQRNGWQKLGTILDTPELYQGGYTYVPDGAFPHLILSIAGKILRVDVPMASTGATFGVTNLSTGVGLDNPATPPMAHMVQGEQFLVIQAGDLVTLPLFYNGSTLRRSNGITGKLASATTLGPVLFYPNSTNAFTVPAVGVGIAVPMTNATVSSVGKQFTLKDSTGTVTIGVFRNNGVILSGSETWITVSSANVGTTYPAQVFIAELTSPANQTMTLRAAFTVPVVGSQVVIEVTTQYLGNVGDLATIVTGSGTALGDFTVTSFVQTAFGYSLTLKTVASPKVGTTITLPDTLVCTITSPSVAVPVVTTPDSAINEIPAAGPMEYYMGRLWYAGVPDNRTYCAGDIVKGSSGTAAYQLRDSILRVTENPVAVGGDGFTVPTSAGAIRAIRHSANIDATLGEGQLFIFTRKSIFSLAVPVTRAEWLTTTEPLQKVAQINFGSNAERSIVPVNGDVFYQSMDGIRSLTVARRNFQQWGNTPISRNINRLLQFNDRGLMEYASGIEFSNRLLQTETPVQTVAGVAFKSMSVLDFNVISSLAEKLPPAWEGCYEGLYILQLLEGDFGGLKRAFAVVLSQATSGIELWEITDNQRFENGDNRVTWYFETPAYTWGNEFQMKELECLEMWIDKLYGSVIFNVEYRPDSDPCWHPWFKWQMCTRRNSCEDVANPVCYPLIDYRESYRSTARLPKPSPNDCATGMNRPAMFGYQFQLRITIKGWCRIRGLLLHAIERELPMFSDPVCEPRFGITTEDDMKV